MPMAAQSLLDQSFKNFVYRPLRWPCGLQSEVVTLFGALGGRLLAVFDTGALAMGVALDDELGVGNGMV